MMNVGLSTRLFGGAAQIKVTKQVAGTLKLETAQMTSVQDGAVFEAAVLDIKSDVLVTKFMGSRTSLPQMASNVVALVSDMTTRSRKLRK